MTERLVSESAELVALADQIEWARQDQAQDARVFLGSLTYKDCGLIVSALRRLAAQDQKPVGYGYSAEIQSAPGELLHVCRERKALYDTPLYLSPPPAAGWNEESAESGPVWHDGPPPKPWCDEWFIAQTAFNDRVVLTALPEDFTYDFKTADDTYIKADKIKRWMQFPDSQYIAPDPAATKSEPAIDVTDFSPENICRALAVSESVPAWIRTLASSAKLPDHGGADAGVKAQIATLAQRFWTIHPRELQDKGMTREEFYIREMTALVASLSKPAHVAANASAEARLRDALENTNQLLIDVMHDQEADIRDRASKQFDKNIDALSAHLHASAEARLQREQVINSAQTLVDLFSWEPSEETGLEEPHLDKMYPDFYQALTTLKDNLRWVDVEPLEALSAHPHASDCDKQGER